MIELEKFCSGPDRPNIKSTATPFSEGEYTFATNGYLLVRVTRIKGIEERESAPKMIGNGFLENFSLEANWFDVPPVVVQQSTCTVCRGTGVVCFCPECDGHGVKDFRGKYHDYTVSCGVCAAEGGRVSRGTFKSLTKEEGKEEICENCDGDGFNVVIEGTDIGVSMFQNRFLKLISSLPNVKLGVTGEITVSRFTFDGGDGLIMPMRK